MGIIIICTPTYQAGYPLMVVKPQNALDIWALGEWFFQMLAEQRINIWVMRTRCFQVWSSFWWLQGSSGLFYAFLNHTSSSLCLESVRWLHLYNFKLEWPIKNNAIVFLKDRPVYFGRCTSVCLSMKKYNFSINEKCLRIMKQQKIIILAISYYMPRF